MTDSLDPIQVLLSRLVVAGKGVLRIACPCCAGGEQLACLRDKLRETSHADIQTYACESDAGRAAQAAMLLGECLDASHKQLKWQKETMDVLLLQPPPTDTGKGELQILRDMQDVLSSDGVLLFVVRRQHLGTAIASRLANHFADISVHPVDTLHGEPDSVSVVGRKRKELAPAVRAALKAIGQASEVEAQALCDQLNAASPRLPLSAKKRAPFFLRRKEPRPEDICADALRFGVRESAWWQQHVSDIPCYRSSSILPLRDTQIASLALLGFVDNREFDFDSHRFIFKGHSYVVEQSETTRVDLLHDRLVTVETPIQGGRLLSLETGSIRDLDAEGVLLLIRAHPDTFAKAVTDHVPALRSELTLSAWEAEVLSLVYRYKRLPGRKDTGLTHFQKVAAAACAQALDERKTRVVVNNSDTGTGKTGEMFGVALCLQRRYLERQDYLWFEEPTHGGHRRRRMRFNGTGGAARSWMRSYRHRKPFCIAFAAEPHSLQKMAREAQDCLPQAHVRIANSIADMDAFVEYTRSLHERAIAVLIVPKSMGKLGSGWTHASNSGVHAVDGLDRNKPHCCPNCGTLITITEEDKNKKSRIVRVYDDRVQEVLGSNKMRCRQCGAALFQDCRKDFSTGKPRIMGCGSFWKHSTRRNPVQPSKVRYPVAEYIWRRYRDFFDVAVWDEAHDANGDPGNDIVVAYRYLTKAARLGWLEATASNMNGYARNCFTRAFHSSAEVRRRFRYSERDEFAATYGLHKRIVHLTTKKSGAYSGRPRRQEIIIDYPGVQPSLSLLLLPYTIVILMEDLGAPMPPRLEACREIDTAPPSAPTGWAKVLAAYEELETYDVEHKPRAWPSRKQACLAYLNAPWNAERITMLKYADNGLVVRDRRGRPVEDILLEVPATWDIHNVDLLPKEKWLLEKLDAALTAGVGMSIMIGHVRRRIQERLQFIIAHHLGYEKVRFCTSGARQREAWYRNCVRDGVGVIISQPGKLKTSLDLLAYPWIVYLQPIEDAVSVLQSKGRAWRLSQDKHCETYFLYYSQTEEHAMLVPLADKIIAANLLRGGELAGGLMDMGHRLDVDESIREALRTGTLPHLGTLLQQGAVGEWHSPEEIAEADRILRDTRRAELALEKIDPTQASQLVLL